MTLGLIWIQFVIASVVILAVSGFLTRAADIIAFKTGLGRTFIGVVLLATATSLPELGTGVSAVALIDEPDLAAGDAFGSNLFNLMIIGILDLLWREDSILSRVGTGAALVGGLGITVISLAAIAILVHTATATMSGWYVSPLSAVILVAFLVAMYLIYRHEKSQPESAESEGKSGDYDNDWMPRVVLTYLGSAAIMVSSALWLANTGDNLADEMGWEESFVGTQFLALSTSLPELATSIAALRILAPELAIANVLGSNLFNMGLILFLDELAFTDGVLWTSVSRVHAASAAIAIGMTAVVIASILSRRRERFTKPVSGESVLLIGLYVAANLIVFYLG